MLFEYQILQMQSFLINRQLGFEVVEFDWNEKIGKTEYEYFNLIIILSNIHLDSLELKR